MSYKRKSHNLFSLTKKQKRILMICLLVFLVGVRLWQYHQQNQAQQDQLPNLVTEQSTESSEYEGPLAEMSVIQDDGPPEQSSQWQQGDESNGDFPELEPVQTDSPVDAYYADVPVPDFTWRDVPEYEGEPTVEVNDGVPFLEGDEMEEISIWITPLDDLGRCGSCMMLAGPETLPTTERGSISKVKPTGWVQEKYPDIIKDGGMLYNRCHLLAFMTSGMNATEENLITGTRYLNVVGMLPYETEVNDYIRNTKHHLLYRVTPIFEGDELLARGVLIEAMSLEDDALSMCVYCYNVQPGIVLNYANGKNWRD